MPVAVRAMLMALVTTSAVSGSLFNPMLMLILVCVAWCVHVVYNMYILAQYKLALKVRLIHYRRFSFRVCRLVNEN